MEFLLLNEELPRSIRFCTGHIQDHLKSLSSQAGFSSLPPERLAGRLNARLEFADLGQMLDGVEASGLLTTIVNECADIHEAIYEAFVAYPLELSLPA